MMAHSLIDAAMIDGSYDPYTDMSTFSTNLCDVVDNDNMDLYGHSDDQEVYINRSKRLMCKICNKAFRNKSLLKKHTAMHGKEQQYECDECNKKFNRKESLTRHKIIHTGMKFFECPECGRMFNQNGHLQTHMLVHTKEKNFECLQCSMKFARKDNLRRHLLLHSRKKSHECTVCGKLFNQHGHLEAHMVVHSQEKNFQCQTCCMKFARRDTLKRHMLVHTKEKTFECEACGERFIQNSHLKAHALVHTKEKNYKCTDCGKKFARKGSLKRHTLVHSGERTHVCSECGKGFIQKTHLNKHQSVHLGTRKKKKDEEGNVDEFIQNINNVEVHIEQISPAKTDGNARDLSLLNKNGDNDKKSLQPTHQDHLDKDVKKTHQSGKNIPIPTQNNTNYPQKNPPPCKMPNDTIETHKIPTSNHQVQNIHPTVLVNPQRMNNLPQCSGPPNAPFSPGNLVARPTGPHGMANEAQPQEVAQMQPSNLLTSSNSVMALALIDHFLTGNESEEGCVAGANVKGKSGNHWMEKTQQELLAAQTLSAIGQNHPQATLGINSQGVPCNPQPPSQILHNPGHPPPRLRFPGNPEWMSQGRPISVHPQSEVMYNMCPPNHDLFRYYSAPNVPLPHPYGNREYAQYKDAMPRMSDGTGSPTDMRASPRKPKFPQKVIVPFGDRQTPPMSLQNPIMNSSMPVYAHKIPDQHRPLHKPLTQSVGGL
ncbi:hypothetical protein SK128_023160 [Halocaridina rubra]|uniref:C2H2-type domain-containing protein n=1 Tax=Halocaridina rubra TaxID=373956 RepID=A0AAN8X783_HALRR